MSIEDKKVYTEKIDYPLQTLVQSVIDGDIVTDPDYQRDYVYDDKKASKIIESVILGIPIPTVYLCQEADETLSVIDGQQRITSIYRYMTNLFALKGLNELPELNGKKYKDLERTIQIKLKQSTLTGIKILKESQELKYEIFARLNQGAVSLNPQELRNCIYRGTFNNLLEELAKNKLLPSLFNEVDNRKSYQENILRFFALRDYNNYSSSIKITMNKFMEEHRNDEENKILEAKKRFNSVIEIIKQVLGDTAFHAVDRTKGVLIDKFSGSVYDSIIVPFSFYDPHDLMMNADKIRDAINDLKKNNETYKDYTYAATGSKDRVKGRIMLVDSLLNKIIGSYGKTSNSNRFFSFDIKKELFHPGYICSYCKNEILDINDAEVDHIIPFSKGGTTSIDNAQLLHRHCNREKNASLDNIEDESE